MSIKSKVGIVLAAVISAGLAWVALKTAAYDGDRREAEWRFLTRASHSAHGKLIPGSWTMGVFVSTRSINGLLAALKGATISFDPAFKPDEDTKLTLRDIKIDFGDGFPSGALSLLAEFSSRKIQIDFDGEAGLIFEGVEIRPGSAPNANFRVELLQLEPHLNWQWFSLGARGYAGELLATGTAIALSKALKFSVPLPDTISLNLSQNCVDKVPVRDPKDENWVELATTIPTGKLQKEVSFNHPIFASGGMWIGAEERVGGQSPVEVVERGNKTDAELENEIVKARSELAELKLPNPVGADFGVWLGGKSLSGLLQDVASLPAERRTISVMSKSYAGYLAKKDWSDKILGRGGAFVEFNKPDAVRGNASLASFQSKWNEQKGLMFAGHLQLAATADIHVHVDPLIGGGVGTNVGMKGATETDFSGEVDLKVSKIGTRSVLGFFPRLECRTINLDLTTDGRLVGDWGWTKVPQIGGRFNAPLDSSIIASQILLSDRPTIVRGRAEDGGGLQIRASDGTYRLTPIWKMAEVSLLPLTAEKDLSGIFITAGLKMELLPEWVDKSKAVTDAEEKLREDFSAATKAAPCPGDASFAVLLGDIEIGPNNEIVKFLRNAWNDITKGPGKNNEVVKVLTAATDAITAAGQPIDDATKQAMNDIDGFSKKTFGENSEAAKAVTTMAHALAPPTAGKNEDGGITVTVPGGGSVSTGGGHGGLGVTVQTPVGKWKF